MTEQPERQPQDPSTVPGVSHAASLERRLPLLMTGVLVVVLATSLALTYRTLTRSAESSSHARLASAARQVASTAGASAIARAAAMRQVAADEAIRRALLVPDADVRTLEAARAALLSLRTRASYNVELWNADARMLTTGGEPLAEDTADVARSPFPVRRPGLTRVDPADSVGYGDLYAERDSVWFWVVVPVRDETRPAPIGFLAHRLRFASPPRAAQALRELTGEDVTMLMRNQAGGSIWAAAPGIPVAAPTRWDSLAGALVYTRPGSERMIAAEVPVAGLPWAVILEAPLRSIHARTRGTLITLAALSLLLTVGGAAVSWAISRRITRPLASLTRAAEAIARGDYARRVPDAGADEVGRLAASFNRMAREVDAAQLELQQQVEEAQATAEELELSNEQLQEAMTEAESARADAQRANRAKSDFLAVMSHELRTPLNAIGGYAQLLELGIHGPVTEAQRDALGRIARSQAHLLRLINDVLNFARIDAGQLQYTMTDVPLDDALSGLEPFVAPQVSARRLRFVYRPCAPAVTVRADRDKLLQIVLNLLGNAIKFTPEGGTVSVDCELDDEEAHIRVRDTGVGIPPERLRMIFDPFVQLDRTLNSPNEGVGLGLSISRDLARGMGGDVSVESDPARGSVFTLTLRRGTDADGRGSSVEGREASVEARGSSVEGGSVQAT